MKTQIVTKSLLVKNFNSYDVDLLSIINTIQMAIKPRRYFPISEWQVRRVFEEDKKVVLNKWGYSVDFPAHIARWSGHQGGGIDIYAIFNEKRAGIEVEEHTWYKAIIPELLKLGWCDLDYRILAWGIKRKTTLSKVASIEMPPLPPFSANSYSFCNSRGEE